MPVPLPARLEAVILGSPIIRNRPGTRTSVICLALAGALGLLAAPELAAQDPGPWSLRVAGVFYSPTGDSFVDDAVPAEPGIYTVDEDGTGVGLFLGYRIFHRWSVEAGALFTDVDNRYTTGGAALTSTQTVTVETFLAGVDWHLTPASRHDLTLGLFVAETSFEDVGFLTATGRTARLSFDDDYGFGAKLGASWSFGQTQAWFASAEARYLVTIQEGEVAGQDLDLDPVIVAVSLGYRF